MAVDLEKFLALARSDFEFLRETRYLTGTIKVDLAEKVVDLQFEDGKLIGADDTDIDDAQCKIVVRGTSEQWSALLEPKPKPFYQCLQSANIKHGVFLSNSNETFAYLPALNRMTTLLRQSLAQGEAA